MADVSDELDDIDRTLVRELVADGRATLAHLAVNAGLSVSAVQSRVRRLETRGVVTGYHARIDPEAVGNMLSAFVSITPIDPSQPDDAPARLEHIEAIESCHSVAVTWVIIVPSTGRLAALMPIFLKIGLMPKQSAATIGNSKY
jgi:Lrp/AsnC family leucine-responsive transcriptional regulator